MKRRPDRKPGPGFVFPDQRKIKELREHRDVVLKALKHHWEMEEPKLAKYISDDQHAALKSHREVLLKAVEDQMELEDGVVIELQRKEKRTAAQQDDLRTARAEIARLEQDNEMCRKELCCSFDREGALKEQLAEAQERGDTLQEELAEAQDREDALQEQLSKAQAELAKLGKAQSVRLKLIDDIAKAADNPVRGYT